MTRASAAPPAARPDDRPDSHYAPLKDAFPQWLGQASHATRSALKSANPLSGKALGNTSTPLKTRFQQATADHWQARNRVEQALKALKDAKAFAKPILEDALLTRFRLDLDCETVYLRLYIPLSVPWFSVRSGGARTWTVSLLDAALHNFDHQETLADAYEPDSTFLSRPSASGQFETLPAVKHVLSISAFIRLCRELDIGARYALHVREALGLDEPVAAGVLRHKVQTSQKTALRSALHIARINGDIGEDYALALDHLLDGKPALLQGRFRLRSHDFSMLDTPLTGIVLFAPDLERPRSVQPIVAYIPDDPRHPLKEYPSSQAFKQALTQQLREEPYQWFFSRFVPHAQRGVFFSDLSQRLARITWHPTLPGSGLAPWRKTPTDDPRLHFSNTPIEGELWRHLYQQRLNQLLNDARTQAVTTADADRKARWALWDSFVNVATSILNAVVLVAAPFIPGLGELMLGYMAYQLLDEVFEGIVDWAEDLTGQAFNHLMNLLQALVQAGTFAAAGTVGVAQLRKLLPAPVQAFVDRFKPVTLANRGARYWKPDLTPYEQPIRLPPRLGHDHLGLRQMRDDTLLDLDGKLYAVEKTTDSRRYVIKHPTRASAYRPGLTHNGAGAWHSEIEQPLHWDSATLLQRLGHQVGDLSPADQALALELSGVDANALRKMHVNGEPLPPLLGDSLARLRIDRELTRLIARLRSDDPAMNQAIDPQDQLQLLTSYGYWPTSKALRFVNAEGRVVWRFGENNRPVVQIHEDQLKNGDLLKTVLQALSPEEIRASFGERASDPQLSLETRAKNLRKKLADIAETQRAQLFDSRYGPLQQRNDPAIRRLMEAAPQLPAQVAEHLLSHASGAELQALDRQRLPPRLAEQARQAVQALQLNRAYEGQHLEAAANLDTDRLALNSLKLLPGWSTQLRLVARHRSMQGAIWNTLGPDDASLVRTLVRSDSGRYTPYNGNAALAGETDLYSAILNALPDAQREALHIDIHQGAELKQRLRQQPLSRDELRVVLDNGAPSEPPRETLRLLGNNVGYPLRPPAPDGQPTLRQRAEQLYPQMEPAQLDALLARLDTEPGGAANRVAALANDYAQLRQDLATWQHATPTHHPATGATLTPRQRLYDQRNREGMARLLEQAWRRETEVDDYFDDPTQDGYILRLEAPILGPLPELHASFAHVTLLNLQGGGHTLGAEGFLAHFPRLRHLAIREVPLGDLPVALHNMPTLNTLGLSDCQITLSATSQARLASMSNLQTLGLDHNPLGRVPSVEAMHGLVALDLTHTDIDRLPPGLLTRPELQAALLSENRISELPEALFDLPAASSHAFDLSNNPLSSAALERVKQYYQAHGTYWEADAAEVDIRDTELLFPRLDRHAINRFIYALPGDLEAGRRELARLADELTTLQHELGEWVRAPGRPELERARRRALQGQIERSWRREDPHENLFFRALVINQQLVGELPTLSVRIRHIRKLVIQGNGQALQPGAFVQSFPTLDILDIDNAVLGDIPPAVFQLPHLSFLGLPRCGIRLSTSSVEALQNMHQLEYLDLSYNPLDRTPDFAALPELSSVLLTHTGLQQIPTGLTRAVPRASVNLSHNAIEHLPRELFALPARVARAFDLSANPLSRAALEQVKRYSQYHREFFNAQAPARAVRPVLGR